MTKIAKATAETLIRLYNDLYANDREEWFHVRTTDNHILMEVNMFRSYVRVFVDYQSNCYAFIENVQDFDLMTTEEKIYLRVITRSPHCPFIVEVERNYLYLNALLNHGGTNMYDTKDEFNVIAMECRYYRDIQFTGIRTYTVLYNADDRDGMSYDMDVLETLGDIVEVFVQNALAFEIRFYKNVLM